MSPKISVVIPACNASAHLKRCLGALRSSQLIPLEIIVVDDGSTDDTRDVAVSFSATLLTNDKRSGPATARNYGARQATGDVVFFLDADVCVMPDTLAKIAHSFEHDPALDALMGSYDTLPGSPDFISQYRNLMHSFVHQTGEEHASTFWSGCGAIRREVFLEHSGFSEEYGRPAIEDIELGYRLKRAGRKIMLDRSILVTHLKKWTFFNLIKTDIMDRGIPWTELILRDHYMPNDLNLQLSQRVSVALVFILIGLAGTVAVLDGIYVVLPLFLTVFLMLTRWWGEMGSYKRPRQAFAVLCVTLAIICAIAWQHRMYGLIPPLMVTPALMILRHRYNQRGALKKVHRWWGIAFICISVVMAAIYLPAHHLIFALFAVLVLLGLLNSQFYIFLAGKRGIAFMLCAIPFHLLYHFYNGLSFMAGVARHYWNSPSSVPAHQAKSAQINLPPDVRPIK